MARKHIGELSIDAYSVGVGCGGGWGWREDKHQTAAEMGYHKAVHAHCSRCYRLPITWQRCLSLSWCASATHTRTDVKGVTLGGWSRWLTTRHTPQTSPASDHAAGPPRVSLHPRVLVKEPALPVGPPPPLLSLATAGAGC